MEKILRILTSFFVIGLLSAPWMATTACDSVAPTSPSTLNDNASPQSIYATLVKVADRVDDKQVEILALMTGGRDTPSIFPLSCVQKIGGEVLGTDIVGLDRLVKGLGWKFDASAATVKYDNVTNEAQQKFLKAAGWGGNPEIKCRYEDGEMSLRVVHYANGTLRYYALYKNKMNEKGKLALFNLGCKGLLDGMGLTVNDAVEMPPDMLRLDYDTSDKYDISCIVGEPIPDNHPCFYNDVRHNNGEIFEDNSASGSKRLRCWQGNLELVSITCAGGFSVNAARTSCLKNCGNDVNGSRKNQYIADYHGTYELICAGGDYQLARILSCDTDYNAGLGNLCGKKCGENRDYDHDREYELPLNWGRGHGKAAFYCNNGNFEFRRVTSCDRGYHPQDEGCVRG